MLSKNFNFEISQTGNKSKTSLE